MTSSGNSLDKSEPQFEFSMSLCVSSICLQLWSLACLYSAVYVCSVQNPCLSYVLGFCLVLVPNKKFPMRLMYSTEFIALERNKELFLKMSLIEFYKGSYFTDPT